MSTFAERFKTAWQNRPLILAFCWPYAQPPKIGDLVESYGSVISFRETYPTRYIVEVEFPIRQLE